MLAEILPPHTLAAYPALRALRPHVRVDDFVRTVDHELRPAGYRLLGAFADGSDPAADPALAVLGFRLGRNLAWGAFCYVDDLSTLPEARGRGFAGALLTEVERRAREAGCTQIHLDSGVQEERQAAHGLYFSHRYRISSYHFAKPLGTAGAG